LTFLILVFLGRSQGPSPTETNSQGSGHLPCPVTGRAKNGIVSFLFRFRQNYSLNVSFLYEAFKDLGAVSGTGHQTGCLSDKGYSCPSDTPLSSGSVKNLRIKRRFPQTGRLYVFGGSGSRP
jgi:hypothetical protein